MKNAFYFMFKDDKILKKILSVFLFNLLGLVFFLVANLYNVKTDMPTALSLCSLLFGLFLVMVPEGYYFSCIKSLSGENIKLPYLNIKRDFILAVKFSLAVLLFLITVCGISFIVFFLLSILAYFGLKTVVAFTGIILFFVLFLAVVIYLMAFIYIFAQEESVMALFRFKQAGEIIKQNNKKYFIGFGLIVLFYIACFIVNSLLETFYFSNYVGIIISSVLMSLISTYGIYFTSYVIAKSVEYKAEE